MTPEKNQIVTIRLQDGEEQFAMGDQWVVEDGALVVYRGEERTLTVAPGSWTSAGLTHFARDDRKEIVEGLEELVASKRFRGSPREPGMLTAAYLISNGLV